MGENQPEENQPVGTAPGQDCYALYAIRYATSPHRTARDNFMPPHDLHDAPMPMDFFVWLAVSESSGRAVLIDTGADVATCIKRGHEFLIAPSDALARLGVLANAVGDVIITHLHWDHAGNLPEFANAMLHVHAQEAAYATGPCMCHPYLRRAYDIEHVCQLMRALYGDRLRFSADGAQLAPGISVHHVGGHAPGLQVVRVRTARGWVVLASDAIHFYRNASEHRPFPSIVNMVEYLAAFDKVKQLADSDAHIVAGHDPRVMDLYPAVPGMAGLAVRLHLEPV